MRFWDSSAFVSLCVEQPGVVDLWHLLRVDSAIAVWWGTPVECCSAFARLRRMGGLAADGQQQARDHVTKFLDSWTEVLPSNTLRRRAIRLIGTHDLRAADSLQLAAALAWAGQDPEGREFVCLDPRLARAAQAEGLTVLPASAAV